ncbi:MAG: glycosyltransferase [Clostridia bacterium]|nr:glycosyltransferase [Clostridia bacterium]
MKDLLFVCYGLGIGGIEKCLVNLINVLPEKEYSVDVLLMNSHYDLLKSQITRTVNFVDDFKYVMNTEMTLNNIRSRGGVLRNLDKFIKYCIFRMVVKLGKNPVCLFKSLSKKYDVAIAYSHHDYSPKYVADKVKAAKKVLWYHNGAYIKEGKAYQKDKECFSAFDFIVAVSTDCKNILKEKFAFLEDKFIVLRNICDVDHILKKSREQLPLNFNKSAINIVTVGRLTKEKGADIAIEACKILCDDGYNICWHWIGDGNQVEIMEDKVKSMQIEDSFVFEGNQDNPYQYINCADLYVQTSYYEAYSTTVTEAKVLCKPIVTTDVGGMRDQIKNGINGIITPISAYELANAIKSLIENDDKRSRFSAELEKERLYFTNSLKEYENTVFL